MTEEEIYEAKRSHERQMLIQQLKEDMQRYSISISEMGFTPDQLAQCISFENSNMVAYHLYHDNYEAAKALSNELKVWL